MKQATFKEQQALDARHKPTGLVDDNRPWYGDIQVKLKQELEIFLNGGHRRFGPGTVSVDEETAKLLLAQGRRMAADVRVGPVAVLVEEDVEK